MTLSPDLVQDRVEFATVALPGEIKHDPLACAASHRGAVGRIQHALNRVREGVCITFGVQRAFYAFSDGSVERRDGGRDNR